MKFDCLKIDFETQRVPEHEVRFRLDGIDCQHSVYFRSCDVVLEKRPEVLAAAGILPAMRQGKDLEVGGALDPVFSENLNTVQRIFEEWEPSYQTVSVRGGETKVCSPEPERARVGLFFSGGVDSFYSLLEHQDEVTDLIFVHGFDIRPDDHETCRRAEQSIRYVAEQLGKRVIKIETNIRTMLNPYGGWGERTHGAAMAATAHLLSEVFAKIYIAASDTEDLLSPWGSHPQLDPLWSSSTLEFAHHGCETNRPDKLRRIAGSKTVLNNLRVCWKNRKGGLNCGRCEKCIRTMIGLRVMGISNLSGLFDAPLSIWRVMGIKIPHADIATGQFYNLAELKKKPQFWGLYVALLISFAHSLVRLKKKQWMSHGRKA